MTDDHSYELIQTLIISEALDWEGATVDVSPAGRNDEDRLKVRSKKNPDIYFLFRSGFDLVEETAAHADIWKSNIGIELTAVKVDETGRDELLLYCMAHDNHLAKLMAARCTLLYEPILIERHKDQLARAAERDKVDKEIMDNLLEQL